MSQLASEVLLHLAGNKGLLILEIWHKCGIFYRIVLNNSEYNRFLKPNHPQVNIKSFFPVLKYICLINQVYTAVI